MAENKPIPINEGVLIERDKVLIMRERMEKLSERLDAMERDYIAQ